MKRALVALILGLAASASGAAPPPAPSQTAAAPSGGERAPAAPPSAERCASALAGTYRLRGSADVHTSGGLLDDRYFGDVTAILTAGPRCRDLRVRLESDGYACTLEGKLGSGPATFTAGQPCRIAVDQPGARGNVDATLRDGTVALTGSELAIRINWTVAGTVRLSLAGQRIEIFGRQVEAPATWGPPVALDGTVESRAFGSRAGAAGAAAPSRAAPAAARTE